MEIPSPLFMGPLTTANQSTELEINRLLTFPGALFYQHLFVKELLQPNFAKNYGYFSETKPHTGEYGVV
jgi:hypothetical protein